MPAENKQEDLPAELVVPDNFSPFTGSTKSKTAPFWVVDEKTYDFSSWMNRHPGGKMWFPISVHRDISILYHAYHKDSRKLAPVLAKYEMADPDPDQCPDKVSPSLGVPPFLLAPGFDARRDIPLFDFKNPKKFLCVLREKVLKQDFQDMIKRMDWWFDAVTAVIIMVYIYMNLAMAFSWLPNWATIISLVVLRTCMGAAGHYCVHRSKPCLGESLFDNTYVGTSLIGEDGHVLLHHPYTQSGGDVKRTFFVGMMSLPWWFRIPGYTLHKLGIFCTGLLLRGLEISCLEGTQHFRSHFWLARTHLYLEFFLCMYGGQLVPWFLQYFFSLWYNTFVIVSSHDFEDPNPATVADLPPQHRDDWGILQLSNCFDFTIVGNKWLDVFLSAGLSPHRAHHLLPYQASGFANIASEGIIRETCKEFGLEWKPVRHFWKERFPTVFKHYVFGTFIDPRTSKKKKYSEYSPRAVWDCIKYVASGFIGFGAI